MTSFETQRVLMDLLELQLVLCEHFIRFFLFTASIVLLLELYSCCLVDYTLADLRPAPHLVIFFKKTQTILVSVDSVTMSKETYAIRTIII
jgi:hypothetical protein